jgi:hypothetical protein
MGCLESLDPWMGQRTMCIVEDSSGKRDEPLRSAKVLSETVIEACDSYSESRQRYGGHLYRNKRLSLSLLPRFADVGG